MRTCPDHYSIEMENLSVTIDGKTILDDLSIQVPCHGVTALVGPNGAGKSTLISVILGQAAHSGELRFGSHIKKGRRRPRLGLVPQSLAFDRDAPVTVLDFLCLAEQKRPLWLGHHHDCRDKARRALEFTNAADLAEKPLGVLSGGELKRVLVAQAVRNDPDILLLDEPAAGMDKGGEELFCELLDRFSAEKSMSVLWVSHDLSAVNRHADWVIALRREIILQGKPREVLTPQAVSSLYGLMAIGAEPAHCEDCDDDTPHVHLDGKEG